MASDLKTALKREDTKRRPSLRKVERSKVKPTFLTLEDRQVTTFVETDKSDDACVLCSSAAGDIDSPGCSAVLPENSEYQYDDKEFVYDTHTPTPDIKDEDHTLCQSVYIKACIMLGITPSTYFTRNLSEVFLAIPYLGLGARGAKAIAIALVQNTTISKLDLANNDIGPEGLGYILEMLQVNKNIIELNLSGNDLLSTGAKMLCESLKKNSSIKKLEISDNGFKENDAKHIAKLLSTNSTLKELALSHSSFREKGGIFIAEALEYNSTLTSLDLSWNHLRQIGAVAICSSLAANTTLKSLNLSWNGFGMEGCHAIGKSLMQNRSLTELDLTANRVSFDAFRQLLRGVIKNKSLRILRVGVNPITTDGAFSILRSIAVAESNLQLVDLTDVSVDSDFLILLREIQKTKDVKVLYGNTLRHDEIRKGDIIRVLDTDDPITVLFEYMKSKNLRLIDLLHNLDRDHSDTLSREEFQHGLSTIDLPLSSRSLDILMQKLDINCDGYVDYEELSIRHKEYMRRITKLRMQADEGPSYYKGFDKLQQLREAVRLKISLNVNKSFERS